MAEFKVVRYDNNTNTPIADGQVLVDKKTTAMSFDVDGQRISSNYTFGIHYNVSAYEWYRDNPNSHKYTIYAQDLEGYDEIYDQIPADYSRVAILFQSGEYSSVGRDYVYSDEPMDGTVLLLYMPKNRVAERTRSSQHTITVFHLDESNGSNIMDSGGIAPLMTHGCSQISGESRFGLHSCFKSTVGSIEFGGLDLYSFTIEWWEKAASSDYNGSACIQLTEEDEFVIPAAPKGGSRRNPDVWHHIALTYTHTQGYVTAYVDGRMVALFNRLYPDAPIYDLSILSSPNHVVYMSELSILNYNKYTKEFAPPDRPYVGAIEPVIYIAHDVVLENVDDNDTVYAPLPADIQVPFGEVDYNNITVGAVHLPTGVSAVYRDGQDVAIEVSNLNEDAEFDAYIGYPHACSKKIRIKVLKGSADDYEYPEEESTGGASVDLGPIEERLAAVEEISRINSDEITGAYGAIDDCVLQSDFDFLNTVTIPALTQNIQEDYTATINGLRQEVSNTYATLTALGNLSNRVNECATTSELNAVKDSLSKYALAADLTAVNNKFSDYATISSLNSLTTRVNECATISELNTVKNSLSKYALATDLTVINNKFSSYATIASLNNVASDISLKLNENDFTEWINNDLDPRLTALENSAGSGGGGSTEEVLVSGTTPTIASLEGNKAYVCTSTITSLTVSSINNGYNDATIVFTTGSSFTASFPSSLKWTSNVSFSANTTYIVAICGGIATASGVING